MLIELISVDVVDINKSTEERALLDTEEDRKDFDERWDPWDYTYEYKGPFNYRSLGNNFLLPEGLERPSDFGCCYDIWVRIGNCCVVRIESYDSDSYIYKEVGYIRIGTPQPIWSFSDVYDLLLRYKKQIRVWKKRYSTST